MEKFSTRYIPKPESFVGQVGCREQWPDPDKCFQNFMDAGRKAVGTQAVLEGELCGTLAVKPSDRPCGRLVVVVVIVPILADHLPQGLSWAGPRG